MKYPTSLALEGRHILISGAAGGIGVETARLLGSMGAKLTLTDVASLDPLVGELKADGVDAEAFRADLTRSVDLPEERLADVYGVAALAGIFVTDDWMDDADWEETFHRVMDINVLSTLRLLRTCLPIMENKGEGRVVFVGSLAGRMGGDPKIVQPHYTASKSAIHAITYNMARRYGPKGICVNAIAPGTIATPANVGNFPPNHRFAAGRMGTALEVAWPIAFLCSPHVSYMWGSVMDVNGGAYMV